MNWQGLASGLAKQWVKVPEKLFRVIAGLHFKICLWTTSPDFFHCRSALRRSCLSGCSSSATALYQGVGFLCGTYCRMMGAWVSKIALSLSFSSEMDVSGEIVLAMSCFRAAKSIFDKQRIGATSGLVAGLGMFKWHSTAVWSEGNPWCNSQERRISSCPWNTRSRRCPFCVGRFCDCLAET